MNQSVNRWLQMVLMALLLAVPMRAGAQLAVDVHEAEITVSPGDSRPFDVTIENRTDDTVYLTGISSSLSPEYATADVYDLYMNYGPDSLGPGEGWEGPLLLLTIAPETPIQSEVFGVNLSGGAHPYDEVDLATFYFVVDVVDPVSKVPDTDAVPVPERLQATPNPFAGRTTLQFSLNQPQSVEVRIFDVTGRTIRSLFSGEMETGQHQLEWDGLDDTGARSNRGIYFIRVQSGRRSLITKVVQVE